MSAPAGKRCVVAYATARRQFLWTVDLPREANIAEAIEAARRLAPDEPIPWDSAPVGVFGRICDRAEVPADGERIELYRPLRDDPKAQRRARLKSGR